MVDGCIVDLIRIRFFNKEGKIITSLYTEQRLESREDIGFAPIWTG